MEDLQQLHRTLGSRYKQLLNVALPKSFDPTGYSARDLANDIRSVQNQLGNDLPIVNEFVSYIFVSYILFFINQIFSLSQTIWHVLVSVLWTD